MKKTIAILAGDGIGPEVMAEALKVLSAISKRFNHSFDFREALVGGAAWDSYQLHFPDETRAVCAESDAILFGSIGGPVAELHLEKWKDCAERSILALRKTFSFAVNLRPARLYPELKEISPLCASTVAAGFDLLVMRELLGDIYFGEHKSWVQDGKRRAHDVAEYDEDQIRLIAQQAFQFARKRRKKLTSVDKANVLDTSKLWRVVVKEVAADFQDVKWEHMFVDNCAMQLVVNPSQFDVILTSNMFGDILSDVAAVLPGSLGLLPSASLNPEGFGLYEPAGGSAPDIAGRGIANPIAQILSAAMLLRYSFGLQEAADAIETAVSKVLAAGYRTADLCRGAGTAPVSTSTMGDAVVSAVLAD